MMRLLIDANVYRHPAASMGVHVTDEVKMWGTQIIATRQFEYRFRPPNKRRIAEEVFYIPALALHGPRYGLEFYSYWLVEYEMWHMPAPYDWVGRSTVDLFKPTRLEHREPAYNGVVFSWQHDFNLMTAVRGFIANVKDNRFNEILEVFGLESSQDAFHVWTCERENIDFIVSLDGSFQNKLRQARKDLSLKVNICPPSEICKRFNISPVGSDWFEARDEFRSTYFVNLFARRASFRDRMAYSIYKGCSALSRRLGQEFRFVIPGFDD